MDKPPLGIWATAFFYELWGVSELTARLFSALCGAGSVIVTYLLGSRLFNRWVGFLGALVLLSSSDYLRSARFGMLDAPLTFFLSLSLLFFWIGREKNIYLVLSGIALALAFLTKSFAALFVFPVVWIYGGWVGELGILRHRFYRLGIFLAAAVVILWEVYQISHYGRVFVQEAVVKHFFLRSTQAIEGHGGNYYFYVRTLVNKYHPWVMIGIFSAPFFLWKAARDRKAEIVFVAAWMFSIFLILTLMRTKLAWYLLPTYPALSISVGSFLAKIFDPGKRGLVSVIFLSILAAHAGYSHVFSQDYSRAVKGIAPAVARQVPGGATVYLYRYHGQPEAIFYLEKKIDYLDDEESLASAVNGKKSFFCLMDEKDWAAFRNRKPSLSLSVKGSFEGLRLIAH